jgi:hypothetical protein
MPYEPPAPRPTAEAQTTAPAVPRSKLKVTVSPLVYQEFTDKVKTLTAAQRTELQKRLERAHADAVAAGDMSRDQHYHRLLDIVEAKP